MLGFERKSFLFDRLIEYELFFLFFWLVYLDVSAEVVEQVEPAPRKH